MKGQNRKTKAKITRILKQVKYVAPDSIKPYKKNPRVNDNAVPEIEKSIASFDFLQPIVVDKKGEIIVGHTRWLAAKELELAEVPVIYAAHLTPKQVKAYRIADNKTNQFSIWDMDLLPGELKGLGDFYTGFDDEEFKRLVGDVDGVDFPELNSGGKEPFQQMAFSLHDDQAEIVKDALEKAKEYDLDDKINTNINGNALYFICQTFMSDFE